MMMIFRDLSFVVLEQVDGDMVRGWSCKQEGGLLWS